MTFRPSQKMMISDLEPLITEHMEDFEQKHGVITDASWIAYGR